MSCLIDTETPGGEVRYMVTRLYPGHELPQSEKWPQRNGNKWTLELKINCIENNQDGAGQTIDNQFEDDCAVSAQRWASGSPLPLCL